MTYYGGNNMMRGELDKAIFEKYIAPTQKSRDSSIGIEIELPVVNLSGEAVDEGLVIGIADDFREHFSFDIVGKDDDGNINSTSDPQSGDNLSFDCSYSNLELSLGKGDDLNEIHSRFKKYYSYLQQQLLLQ